jgi:hypothetical protein
MKSWGRELAGCALLFWGVLSGWYFTLGNVALVVAFTGGYSTATISIWAFVATMFGVDKVVKNK